MMTVGVAECLAGVLGQCPALAHLDLSCTTVGALVPRDVESKRRTLCRTGKHYGKEVVLVLLQFCHEGSYRAHAHD